VSYVVGRGGKLNPGGVFVVERPGLGEFLQRVAAFAEVGCPPGLAFQKAPRK
jgi:RNA polymerase II subunit A small phosphatase-like protein